MSVQTFLFPELTRSRKLTRPQARLLRWIVRKLREGGAMPTHREMRTAMGWSSVNAVLGHLTALEKKGYIQRVATHKGRACWKVPGLVVKFDYEDSTEGQFLRMAIQS